MKTTARPLVAYRGLWDKFAGPGTLGSLARAYRRGVPSLVHLDSAASALEEVLDLVCDGAVNSRRQPVYLVADHALAADRLARFVGRLPDAFAVTRVAGRSVHGLSHWRRGEWEPCGFYVAVSALLEPVASISAYFGRRAHAAPTVLVESLNVLATAEERRPFLRVNEDAAWAALEERAGSRAIIARVSDMVELDQLDRRIREAA